MFCRFKRQETIYAVAAEEVSEEEREERLAEEARAAGFKHKPENVPQAMFIFLDEPQSSVLSTIFSLFILVLILLSSTCFIMETHPLIRCADEDFCAEYDTTVAEAQKMRDLSHLIELLAMMTFTVEYIARMALCPFRPRSNRSFFKYFKKPLNIVDLLAIAPYWVEKASCPGGDNCNSGLSIIRLLRLARVFRVLKAGNFAGELQIFIWGYYRAREGLLLLFFLLFLYLCLFAALLYMAEYDPQTESCFVEAGYPMCYQDMGHDEVAQYTDGSNVMVQMNDGIDGKVIAWDLVGEIGDACNHCLGNTLYSCDGQMLNLEVVEACTAVLGTADEETAAATTCTLAAAACAVATGSGTCDYVAPVAAGTSLVAVSYGPYEDAVNCETPETGITFLNTTAEVLCNIDHPNFIKMTADDNPDFCMKCSDVQWPGKEPMRCTVRAFTSIPSTWYFIMATMTTVGYGEHYPGSVAGKIVCSFCMLMGIMVLALPLIIIGNAFEETVKEEERYKRERKKRMDIKLLERFADDDPNAMEQREQLEAIRAAEDAKKARQRYHADSVRSAVRSERMHSFCAPFALLLRSFCAPFALVLHSFCTCSAFVSCVAVPALHRVAPLHGSDSMCVVVCSSGEPRLNHAVC